MNSAALLALVSPRLRERCRLLGTCEAQPKAIVYWMRVAVRDHDNPALEVAIALATRLAVPFTVVHVLSDRYPYASDRHHTFILQGARDVAQAFRRRSIPYAFHLERPGNRAPVLRMLAASGCLIVTDLMPTAPLAGWTASLAKHGPVLEVDASCLLPMPTGLRVAPTRAFEFRKQAAPRTAAVLATGYPSSDKIGALTPLLALPFEPIQVDEHNLADLVGACAIDHGVAPVPDSPGGMQAGYARWQAYVATQLHTYADTRNDPMADSTSRMSPYLHYGHVSPFRLGHELQMLVGSNPGAEKLLDEMLVWRELAWHHAYHDNSHTEIGSIPGWARATLAQHERDPRPLLPSRDQLARGTTDDELWNACQRSLLAHGELHNNVRMTWGKKFLDWAPTAAHAFAAMVDLNHRYALDGRDPASYGGLRWCLGAFDRPFAPERTIVGTVRARPTAMHRGRLDIGEYYAWVRRSPFARQPTVAVIGAGVAGLAAARVLHDHNINVKVFDKGTRPGGRLVSRNLLGVPFDYGAQYFTVRNDRFLALSQALVAEGVLAEWQPRRMSQEIEPRDAVVAAPQRHGHAWYVAPQGFSAFAARLAAGLHVQQPMQVQHISRNQDAYTIAFVDGAVAQFDEVLVTAPGPQQGLLVAQAPASGRYSPCWSLTLAFHSVVPLPFDVARFETGTLAWVSRESSKPGRHRPNVDIWTLHASVEFSAANLETDKTNVHVMMQDAFMAMCAQHGVAVAEPSDSHIHKWRFASVENGEGPGFATCDGIGFGGDAFGGSRVEPAYLSGVALAGNLLRRLAAQGAGARHA